MSLHYTNRCRPPDNLYPSTEGAVARDRLPAGCPVDLPHGTDVPKVVRLHFGQSNAEENSNSGCRNGCWWVNPSRPPKIKRLVREGGIRDLERCFLALGDVAILPLDAWLGNLGAGPACAIWPHHYWSIAQRASSRQNGNCWACFPKLYRRHAGRHEVALGLGRQSNH